MGKQHIQITLIKAPALPGVCPHLRFRTGLRRPIRENSEIFPPYFTIAVRCGRFFSLLGWLNESMTGGPYCAWGPRISR